MSKIHEIQQRIYYADTDAAGIVYYANYLRFAETARTEMLRDLDFEHGQIFKDTGFAFAVASVNVQYKAPARLDDLITIKSQVLHVGGASMKVEQKVYIEDKLLTEMEVSLVCVDPNLKAARLPEKLREIFKGEL